MQYSDPGAFAPSVLLHEGRSLPALRPTAAVTPSHVFLLYWGECPRAPWASNSLSASSPDSSCKKRVRFAAPDHLVREHIETCDSEELCAARKEGEMWTRMARDRLRFQRRIQQIEHDIAPALARKSDVRRHFAAVLIQSRIRGFLCRRKCCLSWINRQSSTMSSFSEGANDSGEDEGVPFSRWSQQLPRAYSAPPPSSSPGGSFAYRPKKGRNKNKHSRRHDNGLNWDSDTVP